jgi:NADP-dependent 3-hydroxy acid dehydrogenase YdfG
VHSPVGIVTGGLSGIGAASAVEFAERGARLVLCDRSTADPGGVVERVRAAGGTAVVVEADVRSPDELAQATERAVREWGRIDFLLANAGIADQSSTANGDPGRWREVVETNLLGVLYTCRAVVPTMLDQGAGHILIMASVSGREAYAGEPVYIATKWGVVGFAHSLRLELLEQGIRVTLVEPGLVDTPLTRGSAKVRPLLDEIEPLTPEDVARAAVYAFEQPTHVAVSEIVVRPQRQLLPRP